MTVLLPCDYMPLFSYLEYVGRKSQHPQVCNQSILCAVIDAFQDDIYSLALYITPYAICTALMASGFSGCHRQLSEDLWAISSLSHLAHTGISRKYWVETSNCIKHVCHVKEILLNC